MLLSDAIVWGDCITVMGTLPPESVDMVFIDPPYFLQLPKKKLVRWGAHTEVGGVREHWDVFANYEEYDKFMAEVLTCARRLMKPSATIWVIGTYHNIHRIGKIMQDLGFWILNDVIWLKTNATPNFRNVRFTNATETLIWAVKSKDAKGYKFNAKCARKFAPPNFKLAVNLWLLPICRGKERLKDADGKALHPTQKPEALLERIILVSTEAGDLVLDPMAGTGTTGAVAQKLGRRFILIERERKYVDAMLKRIRNAKLIIYW